MGDTEIERFANLARPDVFDPIAAIQLILPRGHVIHGHNTASDIRLMMVLESDEYSDAAPLLGYGADGNAERALCRALLTYAMRERDGLEYIVERHYRESTEDRMSQASNHSIFDQIVWGGSVKIFQEGEAVVAWSEYSDGGYSRTAVQASGPDTLSAVIALTDAWLGFTRPRFGNKPPILLQ